MQLQGRGLATKYFNILFSYKPKYKLYNSEMHYRLY